MAVTAAPTRVKHDIAVWQRIHVIGLLTLAGFPAQGSVLRDDVLIVVNDNSLDSAAVGAHYADTGGCLDS